MDINLSPEEYARLCRIADYYRTTPAWIVRGYIERQAALDDLLCSRQKGGGGNQGRVGGAGPHPDSPPGGRPGGKGRPAEEVNNGE